MKTSEFIDLLPETKEPDYSLCRLIDDFVYLICNEVEVEIIGSYKKLHNA